MEDMIVAYWIHVDFVTNNVAFIIARGYDSCKVGIEIVAAMKCDPTDDSSRTRRIADTLN